MRKRVFLRVSGRVQGVFFRANSAAEADRLGISGWVRNESDGTVYICAEGEEEALRKFIAWCYSGPTFAKVGGVDVEWSEAKGEFTSFEIR